MTTIVNIPSPYPSTLVGTDENGRVIAYIEPLRESKQVRVSGAYMFNLECYQKGEQPCLRPGFKYMFWFESEDKAKEFSELFEGQIVE